ncbi:MAG: type II toxin-antitoxin system RelE/ParE family toxin [Endomicrobium sp.]|jgi:putative addiction module killer protein|nr:type II toxin-antitoxin system RelE/ParE family toxin [Endomicrobium sp.]
MECKILRTNFYEKWFNKQDDEVQEKVINYVSRLQMGNCSNCKALKKGVSELKIDFGKGIRIYYTKSSNTILILLYGGSDKKQQQEDIEKAIAIRETLRGQI